MSKLESLYYAAKGMPTAETIDKFVDEASAARDDIELLERRFLIKCGFKYSCDTPGAMWLYERQLPDGRTFLVDANTAFRIASAIADHETESEVTHE
jgi:predicted transcriptional regulator